jgi:hypothetical protein
MVTNIAAVEGVHSSIEPQGLSNVDRLQQALHVLLEAQDAIISELPVQAGSGNDNEDAEKADVSTLNHFLFNNKLIDVIRFNNCRLLLAAGLPSYAIREFTNLSALSFDQLDEFYRVLCLSIGPRKSYGWYVDSLEQISQKFSQYDSSMLAENYKIFAATCMACALESKDYELSEYIADSTDTSPPFQHKFLEWICLVYWLLPHRQEDAGKWSEIAIANSCPSVYPHIIKCRSLLGRGDLQKAIACLDRAERFFYSNGLQEAYASILHERSSLMESIS